MGTVFIFVKQLVIENTYCDECFAYANDRSGYQLRRLVYLGESSRAHLKVLDKELVEVGTIANLEVLVTDGFIIFQNDVVSKVGRILVSKCDAHLIE